MTAIQTLHPSWSDHLAIGPTASEPPCVPQEPARHIDVPGLDNVAWQVDDADRGSTLSAADKMQPIDRWSHLRTVAWMTPVTIVIWALMFSAVSPPEDYKAAAYGTTSVLPPAILQAGKLATRLVSFAAIMLGMLSMARHPRFHASLRRLWPWTVYVAFGIISVAWSADRGTSIRQLFSFGILVVAAHYIAIVWRGDRDTLRLLRTLSMSLWVMAATLFVLAFTMPSVGALTKVSSGIFHSTAAASASALGIVTVTAMRLFWNDRYSRFWFPIAATHVGVMLVAGNRLSFLVTALVVGVAIAVKASRPLLAAMVGAASLAVALAFTLDPSMTLIESLGGEIGMYAKQGQSSKELSSLSGREEMWTKIWDSYHDAPILGHGYFLTSETGRIYVWYEWGNWTAHNLVLQTLATMGVVGFLLVLIGWAWPLWSMHSARRRIADVDRSIATIWMFSFWFLGWGVLNSSFIGPMSPESVVFFVGLGIAVAIAIDRRQCERSGDGPFNPHTAAIQSWFGGVVR